MVAGKNTFQSASKNRSEVALIGSVLVTAMLYAIPQAHVIAYPFVMMSTLAHEMGHGLASLAVGGHFFSFEMFSDGSGFAVTGGSEGRFARAAVVLGGLVGPAVFAAVLFRFGKSEVLSRLALMSLGALLLIAEFLLVNNSFGWIFVGALAAIFLFLAQQPKAWLAQTSLIFIATQLALSVFSRSDYLFTPTAQTSKGAMPSDVAQIANLLFLPYWFWGFLIGLLSIAILVWGLWSAPKR
jgi:hypothetical protein